MQRYRSHLADRSLSAASINLALAALHKLATEAADNHLLAPAAIGPLTRLYWSWLRGLVRGRLHSAISRAMKPRSASASLAPTSWFTWSAWVKWCSAWGGGVADRLHWPVQAAEDLTDRN